MNRVFFLLLSTACFGSFAATQWSSGRDIGTSDIPADGIMFHQTGAAAPLVFTLSEDATLPAKDSWVYPHNGRTVIFDFSEHGKTLSFANGATWSVRPGWNNFAYPAATNRVIYRGGVWDFGKNVGVNGLGRWGYNPGGNGGDVRLDGAKFKGASIFKGIYYAENSTFVLENGAEIYCPATTSSGDAGSCYLFFDWIQASDGLHRATNCVFRVSSGSCFACESGVIVDSAYWNGGASGESRANDVPCDFRAEISGVGSHLEVGGALSIGNALRGVTFRLDDHSSAYVAETKVGNGQHAADTVLQIDGGAVYTNMSELAIGNVVGADRCRVEVTGGASLLLGDDPMMSHCTRIGLASSNNLFLLSNATHRCRALYLGSADSETSGNALRVVGRKAFLGLVLSGFNGAWVPYATSGNSISFEDADFQRPYMNFHMRKDDNELRIEDGSIFRCASLYVGLQGSVSEGSVPCNRACIFVGEDSTLAMDTQFMGCGKDTRLVISNGTVSCSNQYSFYFGRKTSYTEHEVSGNRLVFQGAKSKLLTGHPDATVMLENGTVVRFEVPSEDYETVPIAAAIVDLNTAGGIEIAGLDKLRRDRSRNLTLISATSSLRIPTSLLDTANESLAETGDKLVKSADGKRLVLSLKGYAGLMLMVR